MPPVYSRGRANKAFTPNIKTFAEAVQLTATQHAYENTEIF